MSSIVLFMISNMFIVAHVWLEKNNRRNEMGTLENELRGLIISYQNLSTPFVNVALKDNEFGSIWSII